MSSASEWLTRLEQATTYRELQELFSRLAAEARATSDGRQLARSIDDAIRRILEERSRDEGVLRDFQEQYDAFKQQQSGFVGWFKRHLPFTETRRREREHLDAVADQQAEILGDNLVIARAQMLKELILPASERRSGAAPADWRANLEQLATRGDVRACGDAVRALKVEVSSGQTFLEELKRDMDAFAGAQFPDKADRKQRDADLAAARQEWSSLEVQRTEKQKIRTQAIQRLGTMVADQLAETDAGFRETARRRGQIEQLSGLLERATATLKELQTHGKKVADNDRQQAELESAATRIAESLRQQDREFQDLERRRAALESELEAPRATWERAQRDVDSARRAREAAHQLLEAYRREKPPQAEADPNEPVSPVETEFRRVEQELRVAEDLLRRVSAPHEAALKRAEEARTAAAAASAKTDMLKKEDRERISRIDELRKERGRIADHVRPRFQAAQSAVAQYLDAARREGWATALPIHDRFSMGQGWSAASGLESSLVSAWMDTSRHASRAVAEANALVDQLTTAIAADGKQLKQELASAQARWDAAWSARCQELLGADLAEEICRKA